MINCDCDISQPVETIQGMVCKKCAIVIDKVYEKELIHQTVAHYSNPMVGEIHPSINRTLSDLTKFINMEVKTRMDIIDRVYQIVDLPKINYILATKIAFQEVFPKIKIESDIKAEKTTEKKKINDEKNSNCDDQCFDNCSKSYVNVHVFNRLEQLHKVVEKGIAKNRNIDEILKNVDFSKTKYYKYRDRTYEHVKKPTVNDIRNPKNKRKRVITPKISDFIMNNKKETLGSLQTFIGIIFDTNIHPSTIHYHRKKMQDAITSV